MTWCSRSGGSPAIRLPRLGRPPAVWLARCSASSSVRTAARKEGRKRWCVRADQAGWLMVSFSHLRGSVGQRARSLGHGGFLGSTASSKRRDYGKQNSSCRCPCQRAGVLLVRWQAGKPAARQQVEL